MYEAGTVLAGKYRIERQIGRGGMGLVLAAEHIELRTIVAIKCLVDKYTGQGDLVKRFLREARACAQLTSEHVCRVFDVGRLETGVPYFVMELLQGRDLGKVLRTSGPLGVAIATAYVLQACDAIQEAHAAQIIHRDLKPGNLFLTRRRDGAPFIKVLDFGIAKAPDEGDMSLTGTDDIMGSPTYMAPEQIRASKNVDKRSDIWSLGVILYELVSGRPPFQGASVGEIAVRIATEPLEQLQNVPSGFAMIVARCLEKDAVNRFQSVGELTHALAAYIDVPPVSAQVMGQIHIASPPVDPVPHAAHIDVRASTTLRHSSGVVSSMRAPLTLRRSFVIVGIVAILGGVGLGIIVEPLSHGSSDDVQPVGSATREAHGLAPAASVASVPAVDAPLPMDSPRDPLAPPVVAPVPLDPHVELIDAGISSVARPTTIEDDHRRPVLPVRRTPKAKSKEQIGESRL